MLFALVAHWPAAAEFLRYMPRYSIRRAQEQDCAEITRLANQLGYPASEDVMRVRLQRLLNGPFDIVFVAEAGDANGLAG